MTFTDNEVLIVLIKLLRNNLPYKILQKYQPHQQGTPSEPFLTIYKIFSKRYGYPENRSVYDETNDEFITTRSQWTEATFQLGGKAVQDPADIDSLTSSDIVQMASDVLQSPETRQTLLQSEIGILRIQDIRHLYFVDDRDRHEQDPSFDFVLTYKRVSQLITPAVTTFDTAISRV